MKDLGDTVQLKLGGDLDSLVVFRSVSVGKGKSMASNLIRGCLTCQAGVQLFPAN